MIFLILAVTASSFILISFKIFEKMNVDSFTAITVNYFVGALFGYNYIHWNINLPDIISAGWFPMSALTGLILIAGFILFSISAQKAGIAITAISSRMAVIISVLLGILVFGDKAGFLKMAGICLAIIAFYLIFKKNKSEKHSVVLLILPLGVFLLMGLNDVILKITQYYFIGNQNETDQIRYAATSFVFGFFIGIPVLLFRLYRKKQPILLNAIIAGIILGLLNWFSIYYLLRGLAVTDVSVFVPMVNVSVVSISSLAGYFIFREKLSRINWIGIAVALFAIVMIAQG